MFTCHTYDAAFILNITILLCPVPLKYSSSFFQHVFLHFTFDSHGFYLGTEQVCIKHTSLIITVTVYHFSMLPLNVL
jgi:hypothetical protein